VPGRLCTVTRLLFAIIITNAFQGFLTSYLAVPRYLPEINTLKSLDKSGLGIFVTPGVRSCLTLDENDKIMAKLWRQLIKHDRNFSVVAYRIARKKDVAGMFRDLTASSYLRNKRYMKDGHPMLHSVRQNILSVYSVCAVPRHSPFLPRFDVIIGRLLEAGLQQKWIGDTVHRAALDCKISPVSHPHAAKPAPIGSTHLQTAFYILLIGLLCSTLVFIIQHTVQVL
jgi:hypothetical protein